MSNITAALVKELRETSGAGMMDCKKALQECDGDMEAAIDYLRTKGLAKAAKKAGRVASEGLVAVSRNDAGTAAAVVEVNSETDFVARNEQFQDLVKTVAELGLSSNGDLDALNAAEVPGAGKSVTDHMTDMVATIGENMSVRRASALSVSEGVVATYIHNAITANQGKIAVLVSLSSSGDQAQLEALGKQIAMHVAAVNPLALSKDSVDPAIADKERNFLIEQARESGKPENIIEKMIEGRMRKFYEEVALLSQTFVIDGESKVEDVIAKASKDLGASITLDGFIRFELGEGIEKKEEDFAAEVAAVAGS